MSVTYSTQEKDAYALLWVSLQNFSKNVTELQGLEGVENGKKHSTSNLSAAIYGKVLEIQNLLVAELEVFRQYQAMLRHMHFAHRMECAGVRAI